MKKVRILALLIAVLMICTVTAASAQTIRWQKGPVRANNRTLGNNSFRVIENGETVSFQMFPSPWGLYEKTNDGYSEYSDIVFNTKNTVKVSSSASWVTVDYIGATPIIYFDYNNTQKNRTAKLTVTASGYKATINLTQLGKDEMKSVKRSGKKVTVKLKPGKAAKHAMWVEQYWWDEEEEANSYKYLIEGIITKKTITFNVKAGYNYYISYGPAFVMGENWWSSNSTSWCGFYVESVSGSESYPVDNY